VLKKIMIAKLVRFGVISDQDTFRRQDAMAMTPSQRIMCLIRLRDSQFGAAASPLKKSCAVSYRNLPIFIKK